MKHTSKSNFNQYCKRCDAPMFRMVSTFDGNLCPTCHNVEIQLDAYLQAPRARIYTLGLLLRHLRDDAGVDIDADDADMLGLVALTAVPTKGGH